jgi:hypothetical protein
MGGHNAVAPIQKLEELKSCDHHADDSDCDHVDDSGVEEIRLARSAHRGRVSCAAFTVAAPCSGSSSSSPAPAEKMFFTSSTGEVFAVAAGDYDDKRREGKESRRLAILEMKMRLQKDQSFVLEPNNKRLQKWDAVTLTALLFTAIITPVEVAFVSTQPSTSPLWVINRCVDVIFIVDMIVIFNLAFVDDQGQLIKSRSAIAKHCESIISRHLSQLWLSTK